MLRFQLLEAAFQQQRSFDFQIAAAVGHAEGDPLEREPQEVCDDVMDEYVSLEAAERDFGVVLRGSLEACDLSVDASATQKLRAGRKA